MNDPRPPLAIHVDLDGVTQIFRAHGRVFSAKNDPIFSSGMENMLQSFANAGIRATLFMIAEDVHDAEKRAVVQRAIAAGHELASHTMTHPNLLRSTLAEKERELLGSKALLEDTFGVPVTGFRAPGYSIDAEGLSVLARAGYLYDSSVFPTASFAQRLERPKEELYRPQRLDAYRGIVELPLPGPTLRSTPIGPSFALAFGLPPFYWAMARAARRGFPTVLLFHLIDFAAPLQREHRGGQMMSLFTLSMRTEEAKRKAVGRMLRFVARRFRLTTTAELLAPFTSGALVSASA